MSHSVAELKWPQCFFLTLLTVCKKAWKNLGAQEQELRQGSTWAPQKWLVGWDPFPLSLLLYQGIKRASLVGKWLKSLEKLHVSKRAQRDVTSVGLGSFAITSIHWPSRVWPLAPRARPKYLTFVLTSSTSYMLALNLVSRIRSRTSGGGWLRGYIIHVFSLQVTKG